MSKEPVLTLTVSAISKRINASEYSIKKHIKKLNIRPIGYADVQKKRPLYATGIMKQLKGCRMRKKPIEKSVIRTVRFNPEEDLKLITVAKKYNMSVGMLLKKSAFKRELEATSIKHIKVADPALLRQLALIGNNLNQLSRSMNQANKRNQIPTGLPTAIFASLCDIDEQLTSLNP